MTTRNRITLSYGATESPYFCHRRRHIGSSTTSTTIHHLPAAASDESSASAGSELNSRRKWHDKPQRPLTLLGYFRPSLQFFRAALYAKERSRIA
jgi:hypothetical protein